MTISVKTAKLGKYSMSFNIIYKLINRINNKVYVGQTWESLEERRDHGWGYKSCRYLQYAIDKYGKENFYYELLTITHTQECADYWEDYFIVKYDSRNSDIGYNIRAGGSKGKFRHSEETKKKISKSKLGKRLWSEEEKKLISTRMLGSLNHNYRKPKTQKQLEKQSISMSGSNNPHYGKPRPQKTKDKISKAQSGEKSSKAKLKRTDVEQIVKLLQSGISQRYIAKMFNITQATVSRIHLGKSWKDVVNELH